MAALLFIFILLLMKFVIDYGENNESLNKPVEERKKLLEYLEKEIESNLNQDVDIIVDSNNGILRLQDGTNDKVFFESSKSTMTPYGYRVLTEIRSVFMKVVPCYAHKDFKKYCSDQKRWKDTTGLIDTVLIEGHSDALRMGHKLRRKGKYENNLDLSSMRAVKTFQFLLGYSEKKGVGNRLFNLYSHSSTRVDDKASTVKLKKGDKIFGVSGYGQFRRLSGDKDKFSKSSRRKDRRIDIRFIMKRKPPSGMGSK